MSYRSEGTRRWYRARPEGLGELRSWLEEFWSSRLDNLKTEVEQEEWRRAAERRANGRTE